MPDTKAKLNRCRKLLLKPKDIDRNKMPPKCRNCMFYQPDFRYRRCLYSICPLGKNSKSVFRNSPLPEEKIIPEKKKAPGEKSTPMKKRDTRIRELGKERGKADV